MKLIKSWESSSIKDSRIVAAEISSKLKASDIILLEGNLGSGKTFLVQHICKLWNIKEDVTSPTFTIIQNYTGDKTVNHIDLYRIEKVSELDQIGWEDMAYSDAVTFIEWPQIIEPVLKVYYKIYISIKDRKRKIKLYKK